MLLSVPGATGSSRAVRITSFQAMVVGQSIHAAICSRLFRLFPASDLVLKQIHLASGLVLPYSLPNKSFKPSPLRGLGPNRTATGGPA